MTFTNIVVVACGRSGTRYASVLLSKQGLPCGHQRGFHPHLSGVPPRLKSVAESSAFAAPFVEKIPESWLLIHQVRHPLKVVDSLIRQRHLPSQGSSVGHAFYAKHAPRVLEYWGGRLYDEALALWLDWNRLILKAQGRLNYRFHRIEDGLEPWRHYMQLVGKTLNEEAAKGVSTTEGTAGVPKELAWVVFDSKLAEEGRILAQFFGYSPST